ncbi:hypothetical protein QFC24_004947 [Naganishia onofrii]|uniref:Uncharacterized protein n=1 Tax=Naganishia onofrii TaxID=1851511 RepID=A0ACC2XE10_9TREE|nr:hypothetical protein QFC24_004947 [Naganishia onofrii]
MSSQPPFSLPAALRDTRISTSRPLASPASLPVSTSFSASGQAAVPGRSTINTSRTSTIPSSLPHESQFDAGPPASSLGARLRGEANARDIAQAGIEALRGQLHATNSLVQRLQDQVIQQAIVMEQCQKGLEVQTAETIRQRESFDKLRETVEEMRAERERMAGDEVDPLQQSWPTRTLASSTSRLMRWNFDEPLNSSTNHQQKDSLINVLTNHLSVIRLPAGITRETVREEYGYERYAGLYDHIIRELFDKWKAELFSRYNDEWLKSGERDRLVSELTTKQDFGVLTREDEELGQRIASLDKDIEYTAKRKQDSATTSRVKSCLSREASEIKIMHSGQEHWCWPEMEGVMSEKYIEAFLAIKNYALVERTQVYPTTLSEYLPSEVFRPEAQFFWPQHKDQRHLSPQRWMFDPSFLARHPEYQRKVAPFDEPTSLEDVRDHPWYTGQQSMRKLSSMIPLKRSATSTDVSGEKDQGAKRSHTEVTLAEAMGASTEARQVFNEPRDLSDDGEDEEEDYSMSQSEVGLH